MKVMPKDKVLTPAVMKMIFSSLLLAPKTSLSDRSVLRAAINAATADKAKNDPERALLLVSNEAIRQNVQKQVVQQPANRVPRILIPVITALPAILSDLLPADPVPAEISSDPRAAAIASQWATLSQTFTADIDKVTTRITGPIAQPVEQVAMALDTLTPAALLGVKWPAPVVLAFCEAYKSLRTGRGRCSEVEFAKFASSLLRIKPSAVSSVIEIIKSDLAAVDRFYSISSDFMREYSLIQSSVCSLILKMQAEVTSKAQSLEEAAVLQERANDSKRRLETLKKEAELRAELEQQEAERQEMLAQYEAEVKAIREAARRAEDAAKIQEYHEAKDAEHRAAAAEEERAKFEQEEKLAAELKKAKARVADRSRIDSARVEERRREASAQAKAKAEAEARLAKLAATVAPDVKADRDRAMKGTFASQGQGWGAGGWRKEMDWQHSHRLPELRGYSEADLGKDKRFQLLVRLGEAGLLHSDYGMRRMMALEPVVPVRASTVSQVKLGDGSC
ncbi:hypothetical protein J8273_4425 [Carpediemonas membranifera]|uniref:Uncharacterized protein n=1 Tax=Carpediemonas membranifera TaxID=201153 RepID=A0A8J6BBR0_9EUKA|nr:hypothetical protein J8273_4425 [Carpediemonas membranifera]|eukprot:KAG9394062.1 hypothetical protein J8273_4425 [Carpediemonas membranifera]